MLNSKYSVIVWNVTTNQGLIHVLRMLSLSVDDCYSPIVIEDVFTDLLMTETECRLKTASDAAAGQEDAK
jgi:hypothetical protein